MNLQRPRRLSAPGGQAGGTREYLTPRVLERGRLSMRHRLLRLQSKSWQIGQCAVAAAVAWLLASELLGHSQPFLAPVAAIVCLGVSYGQRLRRVAEVTVGVSVGVGVADLFIHWVGTGLWQISVIVAAAMSIAVLLDAGTLVVTQAAAQSVIVAILIPATTSSAGFTRWLDALVGGSVALVAAAVVPRAPLRRPREQAARIVRELGLLLRSAAKSVEGSQVDEALRTLERARDTEAPLNDLRAAAREGLDVVRSSPFRRRHGAAVRKMAELVVPLDRAMRNTRVLVRRIVAANRQGQPIPESYLALVERVADAADIIADELAAGRLPRAAQEPLADVAQQTAMETLDRGLSAAVVLAQVRSIVVDLMQMTGLTADEARELMPAEPHLS